jgi:hypothetical protein
MLDRDTQQPLVDRHGDDTSTPQEEAQPTVPEPACAQPLPPALREVFVDVLARRLLARRRAQGVIDGADADTRDAQRARDADVRGVTGDREVTRA